jgi:tripartite-type tricarboxylate transporter receptor subunit TctC
MEKFRLAAGFQGDFIPFRGAPEVLTEVITGWVDACYAPLSAALEFIRTGKLVALSVSSISGRRRCRTFRPRSKPAIPILT